MTQKELNYIEDVYNHELLLINILNNTVCEVDDEKYISLLNEQIKIHESLNKKLIKLLEANI